MVPTMQDLKPSLQKRAQVPSNPRTRVWTFLRGVGALFHDGFAGGIGHGAGDVGDVGGGEFTPMVFLKVAHHGAGVVVAVFVGKAAGQQRGGGTAEDARFGFKGAEGGSARAGLIDVALHHDFAPGGFIDFADFAFGGPGTAFSDKARDGVIETRQDLAHGGAAHRVDGLLDLFLQLQQAAAAGAGGQGDAYRDRSVGLAGDDRFHPQSIPAFPRFDQSWFI
jgi:hypothetical protein